MLDSLKSDFRKMKRDRTGERFKNQHERAKKRGLDRGWMKALFFIGAFISAAIGVVLVFIPGPAFVFFILAGALVAIPWWPAARALDNAEAAAMPWWRKLRSRWTRKPRRSP
jgi:Flp pilus assembly protein TadB